MRIKVGINPMRLRTRLPRKELAAADTGGCLDEEIPEEKLRDMLAVVPGSTLNAGAILEELKRAAGWYRLMNASGSNELSMAEKLSQAGMTIGIVDSLLQRLGHMEPTLEAVTDGALYPATKQSVSSILERIEPDLQLLLFGLKGAVLQMEAWPKTRGRKRNSERNRALHTTIEAVRSHSTPQMNLAASRSLARALLTACRVHVPQDDRELQRLASPKKRTRRGK